MKPVPILQVIDEDSGCVWTLMDMGLDHLVEVLEEEL